MGSFGSGLLGGGFGGGQGGSTNIGFGNYLSGGEGIGGFFSSSGPFGYESGRTEGESSQRPDPLTMRGNQLRFDQLQDIIKATGGLGGLFGPGSDKFFQLSGQANDALQRAVKQSQMPGLTPNQWYNQAITALDPTTWINQSQQYLQDIATPQLQSQYAAMGLGRSGALGESLTRAGTSLALPIAQQQLAQRGAIEQQRPNVDVALRQAEIARQFAGFQSADIPRQLDVANLQRKTEGLGQAFNLVPYTAGTDSTSVNRQYGNIIMDLLGMVLGSGVGQAALGAMTGMPTGIGGVAGAAGMAGGAPYATPPGATAPPALPTVPYPVQPQMSPYGPYSGGYQFPP